MFMSLSRNFDEKEFILMSEKVLYSMMLKIKEENEKLRKKNELNAFKGIF